MRIARASKLISAILLASTAHAGTTGIYEPEVKWDKMEVSVCWRQQENGNKEFTFAEKDAVREIIQQEFTADRTGLYFVGWDTCNAQQRSDIVINTDTNLTAGKWNKGAYYEPHLIGQAEIGQGGEATSIASLVPVAPSMSLAASGTGVEMNMASPVKVLWKEGFYRKREGQYYVYLYVNRMHVTPNESYLYRMKMNALHEFAHLASLRHEHAREEARKDPNCSNRRLSKDFQKGDAILTTTEGATPYDPNSITSYCWEDTLDRLGSHFFHLRDPKTYAASKAIVKERYLRFYNLPNLMDETIYSKTENAYPGVDLYTLKLGLSAGDLKAIRCLYATPKPDGCKDFKPQPFTVM